MTLKKAVEDFVNIHNRFSDYWFMQECWEMYIDNLARDKQITEKQRCNWGNPCTPETFKKWSNKWYGLKEYDYEKLAPTCESIRVGCCKDYYQE